MFTRRSVVAGAAAGSVVLSSGVRAAEAAPEPPSLHELTRQPVILDTALSPDGSRVAVLREQREGDKRMAYLRLIPTDALGDPDDGMGKMTQVLLGDTDVEQVEWANDERLLVWLRFDTDIKGRKHGFWYYDTFIEIPVRRVMAIGADGNDEVVLFANQKSAMRRDFDLSTVVDPLVDDPRAVLMQIWDYGKDCYVLHRVDVYTGASEMVERGAAATDGWFTQNGVPVLRYDSNRRGTTVTLMARAPGETDWKLVRKMRRNELKKFDGLDVVGATPEAGVLLISHRAEDEDAKAIRKFDLRTLEIGEVVVKAPPGLDLEDVVTDENRNLIGAVYLDDRVAYSFADPKLVPHYKGLNTYFEQKCNVRIYDTDVKARRMILSVSGPREAGAFYLYDREKTHLNRLGSRRPWLSPERLATMETLKVRTRDGQTLTAYLTVPLATGKRPLIVMPHGGPEQRDSYDFDLWAQFLAAQGWMVLQPNFRGSSGYGKAFAEAGHRRWGDRMQEDVDGCIAHVIASGRVDAGRVAIFGASYGGYAALMGVVRRPDLYRCAVAIAGDCDLELSLDFTRREDGADSPAYAYWVKSMGDPKTDGALLRAASPRFRVDEIKAPVFLIHGSEDDIVTPQSSREMAKALRKAGKPHEYLELKGVGHNGWPDETMREVLDKSAAFIRKAFA